MIERTKTIQHNILGNILYEDILVRFKDTGEIVLSRGAKEFSFDVSPLIALIPSPSVTIEENQDEVYYRITKSRYWVEIGFNFTLYPDKIKWFLRGELNKSYTIKIPFKRFKKLRRHLNKLFFTEVNEVEPDTGEPVAWDIAIDFEDIKNIFSFDEVEKAVYITIPKNFNIDPLIVTGSDYHIEDVISRKDIVVLNGVWYLFIRNGSTLEYFYTADKTNWISGGALITTSSIMYEGFNVATDGTYIYVVVTSGSSGGGFYLLALSQAGDNSLIKLQQINVVEFDGYGTTQQTSISVDNATGKIWVVVGNVSYLPTWGKFGVGVYTFDGTNFTRETWVEYTTDSANNTEPVVKLYAYNELGVIVFNADNIAEERVYFYDNLTGTYNIVGTGQTSYLNCFFIIDGEGTDCYLLRARSNGTLKIYLHHIDLTTKSVGAEFGAVTSNPNHVNGKVFVDNGKWRVFYLPKTTSEVRQAYGDIGSTTVTDELLGTTANTPYSYSYMTYGIDKASGDLLAVYEGSSDAFYGEFFTYKTVSGGTTYTSTFSEGLGVGEALNLISNFNLIVIEGVTLNELNTFHLTLLLSDPLSIGESLGYNQLILANIVESLAINELLSNSMLQKISDPLNILENITVYGINYNNLSDAVGLGESKSLFAFVYPRELISLSEDTSRRVNKKILESLALPEYSSYLLKAMFSEAFSINEAVTVITTGIQVLTEIIQEGIVLGEKENGLIKFIISEGVYLNELYSYFLFLSQRDNVTLSEVVEYHRVLTQLILETLTVSEAFTELYTAIVSNIDKVDLSEKQSRRLNFLYKEFLGISEDLYRSIALVYYDNIELFEKAPLLTIIVELLEGLILGEDLSEDTLAVLKDLLGLSEKFSGLTELKGFYIFKLLSLLSTILTIDKALSETVDIASRLKLDTHLISTISTIFNPISKIIVEFKLISRL